MRVAIPTNNPGGLGAERSDHFGHVDGFTVLTLDENKALMSVDIIENVAHAAGGCLAPVKVLAEAGVQAIVVGGMGARPMQGFTEAGIGVYFADKKSLATVEAVLEGFSQNMIPQMQMSQICKGSGNCHH